MGKKRPKQSNFLGFRVSEGTLSKLDLIAKQQGKSRGLVAKDAVEQWVNLEFFNQTNEMITISKTFLTELLSSTKDETLAEISKKVVELMADIMKFSVIKPMNQTSLKTYADFSTSFFGKTGLNWFNSFDIQLQDDHFIFRGLHDLNESFSEFFAGFYQNLLSDYFNIEFKPKIEETTPNLIHIDFQLINKMEK